jgi:arabinoxylan arabinofuranohydrolase
MDIPYLFEDSSVIKIGDTWYYSYCSNWDVGNQTINGVNFGSADIVYMTSKDPLSWNTSNFAGNVFKNTGAQRIDNGGNNHHSIIYFKGKYYVAYHSRQQAMREFQEKGLVAYEKDGKTNKSDGNYRSTQINEATFSNGKITCSGDMKGCSQIEALDPYEKVQAETMSNQSKGIEVEGLMDTTVVGGKGEWIKVTGASFEKGASKITARASSKNGAVIKVSKGDAKGEVITYIDVPAGGTMTELSAPVLTTLTGSTDICFEFSGDVTFDYWSFM